MERHARARRGAVRHRSKVIPAVLGAASAGLALDGDAPVAAKASVGDRVEAPFLQLVLERLWRATVDEGDNVLTLERLERLGRARKIVENHLVQALALLSREEQDVASDCFASSAGARRRSPTPRPTSRSGRSDPSPGDRGARPAHGRRERAHSPRGRASARPAGQSVVRAVPRRARGPILAWRLAHERERSRRQAQRRLVRVGGAALALVTVFAALAVWALVERGHANDLYHEQQAIAGEVEAQNAQLEQEKQDLIEQNNNAAGAVAADRQPSTS